MRMGTGNKSASDSNKSASPALAVSSVVLFAPAAAAMLAAGGSLPEAVGVAWVTATSV